MLCTFKHDNLFYGQFMQKRKKTWKICTVILCKKRFLKYKQVLFIIVSNKQYRCLAFKHSLRFFNIVLLKILSTENLSGSHVLQKRKLCEKSALAVAFLVPAIYDNG